MANDDSTNPLDDRLAIGIDAVAADIDVGDASAMLVDVRATVGRRRRRRQAVIGVAAVGALAASGLVVANLAGSKGDDLIVSAPATEPSTSDASDDTDDTVPVEEIVAPDETTAPAPSGDAPLQVTPTRSEAVTDTGFAIEQGVSTGGIELFEWKGGFLALRQDPLPQSLPTELPPEIADQFSQEVQDFFADGLPATIEEATALLQEAGLFDEVSQVVLNNPDVYDAIYGEPTGVVTTVRVSPDGVEWVDADITFPTPSDAWLDRQSTGDRLVMVTSTRKDGLGGPESSTATSVSVWSTTDLVNWDEQIVPLPERPADLADFMWFNAFPKALAATNSGWIVDVGTSSGVVVSSLLDDETRDRADVGFSNSYQTDTGVAIEVYDLDGPSDPETVEFTWAELGLDGPHEFIESSSIVGADWGGDVVPLTSPEMGGFGIPQMLGTEFGFVAFGEGLYVSDDGSSWTSVEVADAALPYIDWAVETEGGLLFSAHDGSGSQGFLYDHESGSTSPVDLPGLPEQLSINAIGRRHVLLSDFTFGIEGDGGLAEFATIHSIATAEVDGYRFDLEVTSDDQSATSTYTLTDVDSDEVVSTETLSKSYASSAEPDEFRFVVEADDIGDERRGGFRVLDPETGDELIAVPYESMTTTFLDENGDVIEGAGDDGVLEPDELGGEFEAQRPDQFLVASTASGLVVQQINHTDRIEDEVRAVAVSGDVVLTAGWLGTFTRITPDT